MDLFAIIYFALIGAFLALSAVKLSSGFHRLLYGLCLGIIAATALPFLRAYWGY